MYLWDLDHGFAGVILIKKGLSLSSIKVYHTLLLGIESSGCLKNVAPFD